jgi:hypothetical protein
VLVVEHRGVRVADFSPEQKDRFLSCLERWLDLELARWAGIPFLDMIVT